MCWAQPFRCTSGMEGCVQEKDERKIGGEELRPFKPQTLKNSRVSVNTPEMLGQPLLDLVPYEFEFSEGIGWCLFV